MTNKTFLDIDDSDLKNKFLLVDNARELEYETTTKPYFIVQPTPGACVKAKTLDGEKIFLNICTSDKIPPPEDISDAKLFEIISEESPNFALPMSLGAGKLVSDKSGNPCLAYDIAINTSYFEKCQKNKSFWLFTISVIMNGVSNKFDKELNTTDYTVLKNRKVIGELQQHRIENREPRIQNIKKPLVEEISSQLPTKQSSKVVNEQSQLSATQHSLIDGNSRNNFLLLKHPAEGTPANFIGLFRMPKGISNKDVTVLLDPDRIVVSIEDSKVMYDVSLPCIIQPSSAKSFLDKDIRVLRVDAPLDNEEK